MAKQVRTTIVEFFVQELPKEINVPVLEKWGYAMTPTCTPIWQKPGLVLVWVTLAYFENVSGHVQCEA